MPHKNLLCKVLLLDEDEDDYQLLKDIIKTIFNESVKLDWYQRDGVAVEMICSGIYRLTLVEYQIGGENGLNVIQKVKYYCPDQVIFLHTSWHPLVDEEQARKAGADGYIKKNDLSPDLVKNLFTPYLFPSQARL